MSFFKNIIELSNDKDEKTCLNEWVIISLKEINYEYGKKTPNKEIRCICSHNIKYFYYVINIKNNNIVKVGVVCFFKFCDKDKLKEKTNELIIRNNIIFYFDNGGFIKITDLSEYTKNVIIEYLTTRHISIVKNALIVYKDNEILIPIIQKIYDLKLKKEEEIKQNLKRFEELKKQQDEIQIQENEIKKNQVENQVKNQVENQVNQQKLKNLLNSILVNEELILKIENEDNKNEFDYIMYYMRPYGGYNHSLEVINEWLQTIESFIQPILV